MTSPARDILLDDALSSETRTKRKVLLGVSLLGLAMVKASIVPKKISALGVDLEPPNQEALLVLMSLVIIYFLVAFLVYGMSDFIRWRKQVSMFYEENIRKFSLRFVIPDEEPPVKPVTGLEGLIKNAENQVRFWKALSPKASIIRAGFDFLLPVVVSTYAIYCLLTMASRM
jgi:hypothetical protein